LEIDDFVPYLVARRLLEEEKVDVPGYLRLFGGRLEARASRRMRAVFAIRRRRRGIPDDWTQFIAFARVRTTYAIVEEMSRILAPVAFETGVVPIVVPYREIDFAGMTTDTPIVRRIIENGMPLYMPMRQSQ
jgi:hypothetical protein